MTRKSKVRYNRARTYRLKLSPTTRAIRSAILGLAFAAGAANPAFAGSCVAGTAPVDLVCTGMLISTQN